jgi:hypothetical protein
VGIPVAIIAALVLVEEGWVELRLVACEARSPLDLSVVYDEND